MKTLEKMNNVEKGKFLADLLPEELPEITHFMEQETQRFLNDKQKIRSNWTGTLVTSDFWYSLVRNVESKLKKYGSRLHKNHRWFADQLFDGYDALFTIYCLVEYANRQECDHKLKQAIHLLFGEAKLILTQPQTGH